LIQQGKTGGLADGVRLGTHHFAHLRAVAYGVAIEVAAKRYLGVEHASAAPAAHRSCVYKARVLARRFTNSSAWRLLGVPLSTTGPSDPGLKTVTLAQFIEDQNLEGFSEEEALQYYSEAYPTVDPDAERRRRVRERLLRKLLDFLVDLARLTVAQPKKSDPIADWLDPVTSGRLSRIGLDSLSQLVDAIRRGGRWWLPIEATGETKARLIEEFVVLLLPDVDLHPVDQAFSASGNLARALPSAHLFAEPFSAKLEQISDATSTQATAHTSTEHAAPSPLLQESMRDVRERYLAIRVSQTSTDEHKIGAWIAAKAGSPGTAENYRREARRFLIWLRLHGVSGFEDTQVDDCVAYLKFLENIPPDWCARIAVKALEPGWAPFRRSLSPASARLVKVTLSSMFSWLYRANLSTITNPFQLIGRSVADGFDPTRHLLDSRALSPQAWAAIDALLESEPPSPSTERTKFIFRYLVASGLRASELVGSRMQDFRPMNGRLYHQVIGKGRNQRLISVTPAAESALRTYMSFRGLNESAFAPITSAADLDGRKAEPHRKMDGIPLLPSLYHPENSVDYRTLYNTVKRYMAKALATTELDLLARLEVERASTHWLRHTFGTRAAEQNVPMTVTQQTMGHKDINTTARYSRAQLEQAHDAISLAFPAQKPVKSGR
jgi:site-specific recombinase XerD